MKKSKARCVYNHYYTGRRATMCRWYSSRKAIAPRWIPAGWGRTCSKWTLLRAFHRDQEIIAHASSFFFGSLRIICLVNRWKHEATELDFWILPRTWDQVHWANGHSQRTWHVVSSCCPQKPHLGSTCTFRRRRLTLVGRMLEQARQMKFRTFGGVLRDQTVFHKPLSWLARECSPMVALERRSATW